MLIDEDKIKAGVVLILQGLGEDLNREGLVRTPEMVEMLYKNLFSGYGPKPQITKCKNTNLIDDLQARICDFVSFCEHHAIPFSGVVYVAYLPNKYLIGLDKIDLIVDYCAGRLQLQETMCHNIADFLEEVLEPRAVMVQAYAIHHCALCKGNNGSYASSVVRGEMRDDPDLKMEAFEIFKQLDKIGGIL